MDADKTPKSGPVSEVVTVAHQEAHLNQESTTATQLDPHASTSESKCPVNIESPHEGTTQMNEVVTDKRQKIVRVDRVYDKRTKKFRFVKTAKVTDTRKVFGRYVVTVARCISLQGAFTGEYLVEIRGKYLTDILSEIFRDVPGISFPKVMAMDNEQLKFLLHALPSLEKSLKAARQSEKSDAELIFELEALLGFTQEHFSDLLASLADSLGSKATFWHLWALFPPNSLVYSQDPLQQPQVFRVRGSKYEKQKDGSDCLTLRVDYMSCDGETSGRVRGQLTIGEFDGPALVQRLNVFPFQMHPDFPTICQQLIKRGEKILRLWGQNLQEYKGHALNVKGEKFNSHGRVMIDPATFHKVMPVCTLMRQVEVPIKPQNFTEEQKMMLSPVLYGFSLGDKIWGGFAVAGLDEVKWDETIIDSLVLEPARKAFIRALVKTHGLNSQAGSFDDFVRHKGKGLIGLLAGPPGVGKTLTAEAVAEIAHRPLYSISSGELGENSLSVERQLAKLLELAEAWKAVVLLDEADVFLAERKNDNLLRNAVTSIFLRHLEYYQGILLLTTNRLSSFDAAFQSRIHFRFEYDELNDQSRYAIWQSFVAKAERLPNIQVRLNEDDLRKLAKLDLNGRQIKNCMSISQAVAMERKQAIDVSSVDLAVSFARGRSDESRELE